MAQIPIPIQLESRSPRKASISPREYAMRLIINSYRRKVLLHHPKAVFETSYMLGVSETEWADYLEANFPVGVKWENYGKNWQVHCQRNASYFDMEDAEDFYRYFNYTNFNVKAKVASGFLANPHSSSQLDRDGDQV